jgi:DNA-binding MarR family transcriptional regulator
LSTSYSSGVTKHTDDAVQRLVDQWGPERPDLDLDVMATAARLMQAGALIGRQIEQLAAGYGVNRAEGDVLFALRRSGPPYRLLPSQLSEALLVSSGTLTSRLDRLERKGLIERIPNPSDRRSVEIALTESGRGMADEAVTIHVENERKMLSVLSAREREALNRITSKLIEHIGSDGWRDDAQVP